MQPFLGILSRHQDDDRTAMFPALELAVQLGYVGSAVKLGGGMSDADLDPDAQAWAKAHARAGLPYSPSWAPDPTLSGPTDQAARFWWFTVATADAADVDPIELPGHMDLEDFKRTWSTMHPVHRDGWFRAFTDDYAARSGRLPVAYTLRGPAVTGGQAWGTNWSGISFADLDARIASWITAEPLPSVDPATWPEYLERNASRQPRDLPGLAPWAGWQFSCQGGGRELGMESSNVCLNVVKDEAWWRWHPASAPDPPPPPAPPVPELELRVGDQTFQVVMVADPATP